MLNKVDKIVGKLMNLSDREMETLKLMPPRPPPRHDPHLQEQLSAETLRKAEEKRRRKAWRRALTGA